MIKATNELISTTDASSKKRATVEAILNMRLDIDYINARKKFIEIKKHNKTKGLAHYASEDEINGHEALVILQILNYNEFMATGVVEDAFDMEIYKRMTYSTILTSSPT